jgi:hypothetical protein
MSSAPVILRVDCVLNPGRLHPGLVPRPTRGPFKDDLRQATARIRPTGN